MTASNKLYLDINTSNVAFVRARLRLLEQQAAHSTTSPNGKRLIEAAFDAMLIIAEDLELLLDQHTDYPK